MSFDDFRGCLEQSLDTMSAQGASFDRIAELISETPREVVVTAIGKSGYIAQKFAASLRSLGIPSYFLHAAEAGHGDIGNVERNQIVVAISKSGSSSELNMLLPNLKERRCTIVAITNRDSSPLAAASDLMILTGTVNEGSAVNDVPLASAQAALFACDYITSLIVQRRQMTKDQFLYNHPAGQIGANLRYRLSDYIDFSKRADIRVSSDDSCMHALLTTTRGRVGAVCIIDDDLHVQGYLTDGDFRRLATRGLDLNVTPVGEVMNRNPLVVKSDMLIGAVLELFERASPPIGSAPTVDDAGTFLGIVSIHDLVGSR